MTINERLFDAGLLDRFEVAAISRDRAEMLRLLTVINVEDAGLSVDAILKSSGSCGY